MRAAGRSGVPESCPSLRGVGGRAAVERVAERVHARDARAALDSRARRRAAAARGAGAGRRGERGERGEHGRED